MWQMSGINFQRGDAFVSSLCQHKAFDAGVGGAFEDGPLPDGDDILRQSHLAQVIDRLKLLSPRTWWGIIDQESKKSSLAFSSFDISTTAKSALGLLLPLFILFLWRLAVARRRQSGKVIASDLIAAVLSPWSLQCFHQLYYQLSMPLKSFRTYLTTNQSPTLARATDALKLRIRHRRAYRTRRYDVYLPPSLEGDRELATEGSDNVADDNNTVHARALSALLLIPGAGVSHEAYSEVAARLSDKGFVVAVMSLEPLRLASRFLGVNPASVRRIVSEITTTIQTRCSELAVDPNLRSDCELSASSGPAKTFEWTLMGHSMGSFAAMQSYRALHDEIRNNNNNNKDTTPEFGNSPVKIVFTNKLVLLGLGAFVAFATDLSDRKDTEILIVQGTNDNVVAFMQSRQDEFEAFFPPSTRTEIIPGGTHEGFGSYESIFGGDDGKKSIQLDKQHKRVCDATARFLRSRS